MHSFCAARSNPRSRITASMPVMFCSPGVSLLLSAPGKCFSCTMTQFCVGLHIPKPLAGTFVSVVNAQLKRSEICANAFAQRVRALVVLNGVALLPQFPVNRGLRTGNWCACSHRGAATQTVVCFICGAKRDARHCANFMDELTTRLANGV